MKESKQEVTFIVRYQALVKSASEDDVSGLELGLALWIRLVLNLDMFKNSLMGWLNKKITAYGQRYPLQYL